jgi:flagellin-specific chaperone FliS
MLFCDVEKFVDQFFWCKPSRKNFVNMFIQMNFRSVEDAIIYLEHCNTTLTKKCDKQSEQIQHLENILQSLLSALSTDGNPDIQELLQKMEHNK